MPELTAGEWRVLTGVVAVVVSVLIWWRNRRSDAKQRRKDALARVMSGEKNLIAYECLLIAHGKRDAWLKSQGTREELLDAICLAFVMEGSERSQALVVSTLDHEFRDGVGADYVRLLTGTLERMARAFVTYAREQDSWKGTPIEKAETDLRVRTGLVRIVRLATALRVEVEPDCWVDQARTRLDELNALEVQRAQNEADQSSR